MEEIDEAASSREDNDFMPPARSASTWMKLTSPFHALARSASVDFNEDGKSFQALAALEQECECPRPSTL